MKAPYKNRNKNNTIGVFCVLTILLITISATKSNAQPFQEKSLLVSNTNQASNLFTSFDAIKYDNTIYLKWTVKDLDNNKVYNIERSIDGGPYEIVGSMRGTGGNLEFDILNCFSDEAPIATYAFYRIMAIGPNGENELSITSSVYTNTINNSDGVEYVQKQ